jgi:hypothetical protein
VLRIRQSHIEGLRLTRETTMRTEQELAADVRGEGRANKYMLAGTAWHQLLRLKQAPVPRGRFERGGFLWLAENLIRARSITGPMPGTHELPLERTCCVLGELVNVTGTLDYVYGSHVIDHKTTFRPMASADYEKSLQWRLYLWLSGAEVFEYHLWQFTEPSGAGELDLLGHMAFRYYPYAELDRDCVAAVERFVRWAHEKGLQDFIPKSKPPKGATK